MFTNPYTPYLFVSALIALITASIAWKRRTAPGATPLFLMLISMSIWAGSNGLLLESKDPNWQIFWFDILTLGAFMGTPAFWAFGVEFTNRRRWLTTRNLLLISAVPVVSVILSWTTDYHGLFYTVRDFANKLPNGDWNLVVGPFYWVYIIYSYSVAIFTLGLIVRAFLRSSSVHRGQTITILAGTLVPLIGNVIYNLLVGVAKGDIDPTPLLFIIMGVIYAFGLFWFRLFDMIPVARHTLVEHMQDGVIVIDEQNRIMDINPSALRWLSWTQTSPIGRDIQDLLKGLFNQFPDFPPHLYVETEIHTADSPDHYFDLRIEPLMNNKGKQTGRLIVLRDITRQKSAEKALRDAHDRLRLHLKEIEILQEELHEQAIRDPLTGLFNRRYMQETLDRELARALREGSSIGICMADIDGFKSFNDQHGHQAGDMILKRLAEIFISYSRAEDVVCRYGGEEFLILLPGADLDVTSRRAEDWRRAFEQSKIEFEGETLSTTLSLGVTVFPQRGQTSEDLLKLADEALYMSKHNGRNQVSIAQSWSKPT
jgi:diguanylate cyclase (GGDEF)-like protein/PAS domain S-box-containing protein